MRSMFSHRLPAKNDCLVNIKRCSCKCEYKYKYECERECECKSECDCECRVDETVGYSRSIDHALLQLDPRQPSSNYIDQQVFRLLLPALEETLLAADKWNALRIQKCRFNGLDHLAEILWNRNPRRSKRISSHIRAFDIPLFQRWLALRPPYPKSWLWSKDGAALCIQKHVRGWLVRKRVDVQELRQFWKNFAEQNLTGKQIDGRGVGQQEPTTIKGTTRFGNEYETRVHNAGFVRCKMHRRAIAASRINRSEPAHVAIV
ncbi:IQ domain-containing protein K [Augochlora pura]